MGGAFLYPQGVVWVWAIRGQSLDLKRAGGCWGGEAGSTFPFGHFFLGHLRKSSGVWVVGLGSGSSETEVNRGGTRNHAV